MKLISMTDFVLEQEKNYAHVTRDLKKNPFLLIVDYAKFLKQPLTLGMFIPCGERYQNVLKEPNSFNFEHEQDYEIYLNTYAEAKEKVLFEGFSIRNEKKKSFIGIEGFEIELPLEKYKMTIEDLANDWNNIELTQSAIKQIGL